MIDTDKYEGHTEGPWSVSEELGIVIKHGQGPHDFVCMDNEANAQLMADAPLLLEEVKRLREGIVNALIPTDTNPIIHPLTKLSDLRDAIKELIE